jgi:hypothetical protein
MIHRMTSREKTVFSAITLMISLASFLSESTSLIAKPKADSSLADQSTPQLRVRVYSFPGISPWVLQGAEIEARRMLRTVPIRLNWLDCTPRVVPGACMLPLFSTDLIVRFTAKALPQASASALGITDSSDSYAAAFIFYGRVVALRTHTQLLPVMLGRVMAHEITHLLLPQQEHSGLGLMRGQWLAEDLRITSSTYFGLSTKSLRLMQEEALRRVRDAR